MAQQPIIQGIEAVGSVSITYQYNASALTIPQVMNLMKEDGTTAETSIDMGSAVECTGFRLDSTFLDANPQIASSFMIPMLGGGAVALTNNNRSGTLTINTTRVSLPTTGGKVPVVGGTQGTNGKYATGIVTWGGGSQDCYDLTFLLQCQQGQTGGDSVGSTITVTFEMGGRSAIFQFLGCTVASIKPLALSGNDAVDYAASINYLNWTVSYGGASAVVLSSSTTTSNG